MFGLCHKMYFLARVGSAVPAPPLQWQREADCLAGLERVAVEEPTAAGAASLPPPL